MFKKYPHILQRQMAYTPFNYYTCEPHSPLRPSWTLAGQGAFCHLYQEKHLQLTGSHSQGPADYEMFPTGREGEKESACAPLCNEVGYSHFCSINLEISLQTERKEEICCQPGSITCASEHQRTEARRASLGELCVSKGKYIRCEWIKISLSDK